MASGAKIVQVSVQAYNKAKKTHKLKLFIEKPVVRGGVVVGVVGASEYYDVPEQLCDFVLN